MPPRSRSKTEREPLPTSTPASPKTPNSAYLRPADPAEVQRLVDSAIARAQSSRGITPHGERGDGEKKKMSVLRSAWKFLFGDTPVTYNPEVTAKLTDAAGMFLVIVFAFYFTAFGYLWYREAALASR